MAISRSKSGFNYWYTHSTHIYTVYMHWKGSTSLHRLRFSQTYTATCFRYETSEWCTIL